MAVTLVGSLPRRCNVDLISYDDPVTNTIKHIHAAGYTFGSVIPSKFFHEHFRLKTPQTAAEKVEYDVLYMTYMGDLREKLLYDSKYWLISKPGVGQEIVNPKEQTGLASDEFKRVINKAYRKTLDRLTNIDIASLSDIEKKENSDAIAKLSFFANRRIKRLGW